MDKTKAELERMSTEELVAHCNILSDQMCAAMSHVTVLAYLPVEKQEALKIATPWVSYPPALETDA